MGGAADRCQGPHRMHVHVHGSCSRTQSTQAGIKRWPNGAGSIGPILHDASGCSRPRSECACVQLHCGTRGTGGTSGTSGVPVKSSEGFRRGRTGSIRESDNRKWYFGLGSRAEGTGHGATNAVMVVFFFFLTKKINKNKATHRGGNVQRGEFTSR